MKRLVCLAWLVLSATLLASCSLQGNIVQQEQVNAYNKHHTTCAHCHEIPEPEGEKTLFPPGVNPSKACLDCHKYKENHHPVNFVPVAPVTFSLPLYKGEVTCLTCHEIHGGPQHEGTLKLLRGGPYADRRTICFNCHTKEQYAKINPHIMRDKAGNNLVVNGKPVCLTCHAIKPDPSLDRESNVRFKADIGFLCWRCHPPMPGTFLGKHYLVQPSYKTIAYMNRPEVQEKFTLPRAPRGRITCSTCHNPHQEGIISFGPAAAGANALHKLRDVNLCEACHDM